VAAVVRCVCGVRRGLLLLLIQDHAPLPFGTGAGGCPVPHQCSCCSAAVAAAAVVSGSTVCGGSNRPLHPHPAPAASGGLACCQANHCTCKHTGVLCPQTLLAHARCCGKERTTEGTVPQLLLLVASGGLAMGLHLHLRGMLCLCPRHRVAAA
jgi:hypothetical protein